MSIAFIADCHFGANNSNKQRFQSQLEFFENQFFPYLLKHNIKHVINLGDTVHNRNTIDLFILQEMKTRFFRWFETNEVTHHLLVGNHDSFYRNSLDYHFAKENLNEFSYTIPYDTQQIINIGPYTIGMVPWICDESSYQFPEKCDILCGHLDIVGMKMMKGISAKDGFNPDIFKKYHYVFSGHYHANSQSDNIHYVGTQYQLSWNDFDEWKGFYVLDNEFKIKKIENKINPKHVKIYYNNGTCSIKGLKGYSNKDVTTDDVVSIASENYVKLIIQKCTNQLDFDNLYSSLVLVSKNGYKIEVINEEDVIEAYDESVFESELSQEGTTIDLIMNYIQNMIFERDIKKDKLIEFSKMLYKEAYDESMFVEVNH